MVMKTKDIKTEKKSFVYNKAYIYLLTSPIDGELYKLHRVGFEKYAWVNLFSSSDYACGIYNSPRDAFKGLKELIIIFKTKGEFINYIKSL